VNFIYQDINQNISESNSLIDIKSIRQSINNLLETRKGTRLFLSEYGTDIESYLFDPMDFSVAFQIYVEITNAIARWEPRVTLDHSQTKVVTDPDKHIYWLTLSYKVNGLGDGKFEQVIGLSK